MIRYLEGQLRFKEVDQVIVSCGGVGYRCAVPTSLPPQLGDAGTTVELWVHTQVRDDAIRLIGFGERQDLDLFETLVAVNGLGPKIALSLLSTLSTGQIIQALRSGEEKLLTQASGVGKRLAQRMVMELADRVGGLAIVGGAGTGLPGQSPSSPLTADLESGLINLGFKAREVAPVVAAVVEAEPEAAFKVLFTEALGRLRSGARR